MTNPREPQQQMATMREHASHLGDERRRLAQALVQVGDDGRSSGEVLMTLRTKHQATATVTEAPPRTAFSQLRPLHAVRIARHLQTAVATQLDSRQA
jgi:hypothetical protein